MHATVFTSAGVMADANVVRRVEKKGAQSRNGHVEERGGLRIGASYDIPDAVLFECEGTTFALKEKQFHFMDVLPFGLRSATEVFSVVGRHTNRGLVVGVTEKAKYLVLPYDTTLKGAMQGVQRELAATPPAATAPAAIRDLSGHHSVRHFQSSPSPPMRVGPVACAASWSTLASQSTMLQLPQGLSSCQLPCPSARRSLDLQEGVLDSLRLFFYLAEALKCGLNGDVGIDGSLASSDLTTSSMMPCSALLSSPILQYLKGQLQEWDLWDLALPCALTPMRNTPAISPPHRVGSRVMARRFGCLLSHQPATVIAAQYDVSYTLKYDLDKGIDVGVLHNDVYLVDNSEADPCGVRDVVTLTLQKLERAIIVETCANGDCRAVLMSDPARSIIDVGAAQIAHVVPLLKDALWSEPTVVRDFRAMDTNQTGLVKWKDVRQLIMQSENYGLPLSFQQIGELQCELRVRTGKAEPRLSWMASAQEEEMLLGFPEFEYIVTRVKNMM